jgi:hypothetical protein
VERNTVPLSGSGWMLNVTPKNAFTTRSVCTARGVSCPSRMRLMCSGPTAGAYTRPLLSSS